MTAFTQACDDLGELATFLEDTDWSDSISLTESSSSSTDGSEEVKTPATVDDIVVAKRREKKRKTEASITFDGAAESRMVIPPKRKQPHKIRVLKSDFRRHFMFMVVHTFNSYNFDLIAGFLGMYYRPDMILTDLSSRLASAGHGIALNVMKGPSGILGFLKGLFACSPDGYVALNDTEVRVRQDNTSVIVSRITIHRTMTSKPKIKESDVKMTQLLEQGNNLMKSDEDSLQAVGPRADEMDEIIRERNAASSGNWFEDVTPLDKPVYFNSHGVWIIRLDAQGFVKSVDTLDEGTALDYLFLPKYPLLPQG